MKKSVLDLLGRADIKNYFWSEARSELASNLVEGQKILDVGCGNGLQSIKLAKRGHKVTGFDPLKSAVYNARRNAARARVRVRFVSGTINSLREKFDSILLLDVLEHIKDDANFLKQLKKKLAQNGVLILAVPAHNFLWGKWDEDNEHYRRYSILSLKSAVENAGMKIEFMRYWSFIMVIPALILSRLLRRTYPVYSVVGSPLNSLLLNWFLLVENKFRMPTGTSIVARARLLKT